MEVITTKGERIDVTFWADRMKQNCLLKRNTLEGTPIGTTADRNYFWWDEERNPDLDKQSVKDLIQAVKKLVKNA